MSDALILGLAVGTAALALAVYATLAARDYLRRKGGVIPRAPDPDPDPAPPATFALGPCPGCGKAVVREIGTGLAFVALRTNVEGGLIRVPHACPTGKRLKVEGMPPTRWAERGRP